MKARVLLPFFALAAVMLIVSLACGPETSTPAPPSPPPQQPEASPPPVEESPEAPTYYTEEFDGDMSNWSWFLQHGEESLTDIYTDSGRLIFELTGEEIYAYLMYEPWIYENVRLDASADNRGKNTNSVMLICRYSEDEGWYEFNVGNDGMYQIWAYDVINKGGYQLLQSGGSNAIRSGRDTNEYTVICNGETLSLYINGVEAKTFKETRFRFREGLIGIGVSSYKVLPIQVEFNWLEISQP